MNPPQTNSQPAATPTVFRTAALAFWWRDVIRFLRQKNRIISALATPLVFWILLGFGFTGSFRPPGAEENESYLVFFFPGTIVLIMLFTAIFSTISVIEDRREGILQGFLVSPAHPSSLVLGKLLGGTTLAMLQGLLFCLLAPVAGIPLGPANVAPLLLSFFLVGFAMTGLGFLFAWPLDSTQGFHALMNVFLMPLWMMSGALFPVDRDSGWIWWVYLFNPVTYCVEAVRGSLRPEPFAAGVAFPGMVTALVITLGFGAILFTVGCRMASSRRTPRQIVG